MTNIFKKKYTINENFIQFNINDNTVKKVIDFYSEAPFPNYENNDDKSSINFKGENNYLSKEFKKFIGFNKDVLEVGCGTGQLSLYFSIGTNNRVYALDPTIESINLGNKFSIKNKIENVKFVNADIFDDVFNVEIFDFIWTNGVLHHTKDAKLAFDGDGTNSLYALSLSRNMMIKDIPIQQVFTNVRTEIEKATEFGQSPVEEVKLTGQAFYLNPGNNDDEFKEVEQIIKDSK